MIEGLTQIELFKNEKKVDELIKKNTVTSYVNDMLTKGNFQWGVRRDMAAPLRQFFNGCFLTSEENDPSISMIAYNSKIIAQAGNNAYTGQNLRRGSYNTNESGPVANGYKFVWDWTTSQGNGDIKSVCLCRGAIGGADLAQDHFPDSIFDQFISDNYGNGTYDAFPPYNVIFVIDWEKERGYGFEYDSSAPAIIIKEYSIDTKYLHVAENYNSFNALVATHTIPLASQIPNYYERRGSFSYTGDTIHWIQCANVASNNLIDYEIDTSDWTLTVHNHTYENWVFRDNPSTAVYKDAILIKDGYFYTVGTLGGVIKYCKLSMTNDADVTGFEIPAETGMYTYNLAQLLLPNGSILRVGRNAEPGSLLHADELFGVNFQSNTYDELAVRVQGNEYGTILRQSPSSNFLSTIPLFVSTVNNLGRTVSKTNDLTMKLTYTITEVTP